MASVDDIGSDTEEFFNKLALSARKPEVAHEATGFCLWCGTELPPEIPNADGTMPPARRWCDAYCTEDYSKAKR